MSKTENVFSERLFAGEFYEIKNWVLDLPMGNTVTGGFNDCLCLVFPRKGRLRFDLSHANRYDLHTGHALMEKPNYEYRLRPSSGECTIINFSDTFYYDVLDDLHRASLFPRRDSPSVMLSSTPGIEYLHHFILQRIGHAGRFEIDGLVSAFFRQVIALLGSEPRKRIPASIKKLHLGTVERAKEYLNLHFASDISLDDLSRYCCVSPFHFSRVFKSVTSYSPNQYLLAVRLKHGEVLLNNTDLPVSEIATLSGFNSPEYFATAFRQRYAMNPSGFRRTLGHSYHESRHKVSGTGSHADAPSSVARSSTN